MYLYKTRSHILIQFPEVEKTVIPAMFVQIYAI